MDLPRRKLTKREAAAKVGVTPRTLDRWTAEGLWGVYLTPLRIGGRVYFTEELLNRFLLESGMQRDRDLAAAAGRVTKARVEASLRTLRQQGCKV